MIQLKTIPNMPPVIGEEKTTKKTGVEALAEYRAKVASGEVTVERLNPIDKAKKYPNSQKLAIRANCYDCMGQTTSWLTDVKDCTSPNCALYPHRPGANKNNQSENDEDDSE